MAKKNAKKAAKKRAAATRDKPDSALVVVHGMGVNQKGSFKTDILKIFHEVFSTYSSLDGKNPADMFNVVSVDYDGVFEDYRKTVSEQSELWKKFSEVTTNHAISRQGLDLVREISEEISEDNFFTTHLLDALLYRYSMLGERIRVLAGKVIADTIVQFGARDTHIMGHSLGTSVVHDTLSKLYSNDPFDKKLDTSMPIQSLHMVANVSRLLQSFSKVGSSVVRPGACCRAYLEYSHMLDPFTKIKPFRPLDTGEWVEHDVFEKRNYERVRLEQVTAVNVHSVRHYLMNPKVHLPLFKQLFRFNPRKTESDQAWSAYLEQSVSERAKHVREAFEGFDYSDDSLKNVLQAGELFRQAVRSLGEEI